MGKTALRDRVVQKAFELGANDVGVCLAADLLSGPTHRKSGLPEGIMDHHSILVFGLNHPADQPELDYFIRKTGFRYGNSEGNKRLMEISKHMGQWLKGEGIVSRDLHYYFEGGGVFLKGAAVLAGLGTIGANNLLIHPGYGPRIRLRAHLVDTPLAPSKPLDFDPCLGCRKPCLDVCPEKALDRFGYFADRCQVRMDRDSGEGVLLRVPGEDQTALEIRYCRRCELSCSYVGPLESKELLSRF